MSDYFSEATGLDRLGQQPQASQPETPPVADYFSEATGLNKIGAQATPRAPAPSKEGWGEWAVNNVMGRQDPKEANTGTVFEQFPQELHNPTANAAILGANDAAMGDIIAKHLGDRLVRREKDANGYEVMVTRGQDGQEQRGYVNKPGLDMQDVSRDIYGALPYALTGGATGAALKGAGVGVNALGQAVAAGGTSIADDVGARSAGSTQSVDLAKAGIMAGFGAAGPVLGSAAGALLRRYSAVPGLVDQATGQLTERGIAAAQKAGIDPAQVTPDFAKSFAENLASSGNEAEAATRAGIDRFGIPASRGQITKDPYLLTQEEGYRRLPPGDDAKAIIDAFDERQKAAVRYAALGSDGSAGAADAASSGGSGRGAFAPKQGIAESLNPERQPGQFASDRSAADLGDSVQSGFEAAKTGAKTLENDAWRKASALEITPEAVAELPGMINAKLGGRMPNERATPAAYNMAQELQRIIKGEAPEKAADFLAASPARNVDEARRGLLDIYKSAKDAGDKSMAGLMYDGFNDWIGAAAEKNLLKGDPEAAMALANARGFTKEVRELFKPSTNEGARSLAAAKLTKIGNADSGEAVIQSLFGAPGSRVVADGTVQTLRSFKTALDRYAPEVAAQTWNDVRLAHWTRLVADKSGELVGPQAMLNNIKSMISSQKTVYNTLYTASEQRQINEFVRGLETITYKPPNASGSGYVAGAFMTNAITKLLDTFGLGKISKIALHYSGIGKSFNTAGAEQAVGKLARPVDPNITPAITAGANALYTGQNGDNALTAGQSGGGR